jgi:hypothetical protein
VTNEVLDLDMTRPPAFSQSLVFEAKRFQDSQRDQFFEPRFPVQLSFEAAGVLPKDGRRWIERKTVKPTSIGPGKSHLRFSICQVVALAIMGRLVHLGLTPAESWEFGDIIAQRLSGVFGSVFALSSHGDNGLFAHLGRSVDGELVLITNRSLIEPLPVNFPDVRITIEVAPILSRVVSGLGLMIVTGTAADLRAAAAQIDEFA